MVIFAAKSSMVSHLSSKKLPSVPRSHTIITDDESSMNRKRREPECPALTTSEACWPSRVGGTSRARGYWPTEISVRRPGRRSTTRPGYSMIFDPAASICFAGRGGSGSRSRSRRRSSASSEMAKIPAGSFTAPRIVCRRGILGASWMSHADFNAAGRTAFLVLRRDHRHRGRMARRHQVAAG